MLNTLARWPTTSLYWLSLILLGLGMEGVALYYQYALGYGPCVLCIHIRIWLAGFILLCLAGLLISHTRTNRLVLHLLGAGLSIGALERSWQTLAIERGWTVGSCSFSSGLPDWFALDKWFPAVFEVWESCGYTPYLPGGLSMAEGLVLIFTALTAWMLLLSWLTFKQR